MKHEKTPLLKPLDAFSHELASSLRRVLECWQYPSKYSPRELVNARNDALGALERFSSAREQF